jgi:Cu-processing system permease protein
MNVTLRIAGYGARELLRSRWLLAYTGFLAVATALLLRFSDSGPKALLSVVNVVLLIVPLTNVVFGAMYLYAAREFVELLLAQPVRRHRLFAGLLLGLAVPAALASALGILVPLIGMGARDADLMSGLVIAGAAAVLSVIFSTVAAAIVYAVDDRVRGIAAALGAWLLVAVVYDALVLLASVQFAAWPLERPLLAAMFANPIDLARLIMLQQFDAAALLGYTGALFTRSFGTVAGTLVAALAVASWVAIPTLVGARLFHRKDF